MSDVKTITHYDEANDRLTIERVQDVEPYLDQAKAEAEASKSVKSGDFKKAGIIPLVALEAWMRLKGVTFADFMRDRSICKRLLNDPDLSKFRVWKGRV